MIVAGASPGETKIWTAVRENGDFFALAVQITGKLLKIDGYMLRAVWQALNCLFIHATFCVIATGASPGQTKNEGQGTLFAMALVCNCGSNNWETVVDRQRVHAARRFATCKHGMMAMSFCPCKI